VAAKLKDFFDAGVVRSIARDLYGAQRRLNEAAFIADCLSGLTELELTARGWHVAEAMHRHLPQPFSKAAKVIVGSLGAELTRTDEFGLAPLRYLPHVFYVAKYGLDDFETSMRAQYELTKRFSSEFSIRAFLTKHPDATYARLQEWALDPNVHVRRLVSEGTRPRLPWAPRLPAFQANPRPVLALLELLKDDPERYVQRSVANNLNDIGKDNPDIAVEVCQKWSAHASPGRTWIVKHALRSLVKQGERGALQTLGVSAKPKIRLTRIRLLPATVKLGGQLRFSFQMASTGRRAQELLVDYAVHFVKANGKARPKVFKLRKISLLPAASLELEGKISFLDMTTRRHYPGLHRIDVLVNGIKHPLAEFNVRR
jgi:3-methyladenine DNA glycosylase AlkC